MRGGRFLAKILYIAGYGRSGSTLLDIVLGNHPENVGVGEVSFLLNDWANRSRRCSCGVPYQECEFWKNLFLDSPPTPELTQLVRKLEALSLFLAYFSDLSQMEIGRSIESTKPDCLITLRTGANRSSLLIRLNQPEEPLAACSR